MQKRSHHLRLDVAIKEHTGKRHKTYEDYASYRVVQQDLKQAVFAIADGMGSFAHAKKASQQAVNAFMSHILSSSAWCDKTVEQLQEGFRKANQAVTSLPRNENEEVGTTLSVALICQERLYLGWVGDSRIYQWHQGELQQLTTDHTLTEKRVMRGELAPEKARHDPNRNKLTSYLGRDEVLDFDTLETALVDINPKDVFFLVTDGVTECVHDDALSHFAALPNAKQITKKVMERVKERQGGDDATIITIRLAPYNRLRWGLTLIIVGLAFSLALLNLLIVTGMFDFS